jgi:hypothetical protein
LDFFNQAVEEFPRIDAVVGWAFAPLTFFLGVFHYTGECVYQLSNVAGVTALPRG